MPRWLTNSLLPIGSVVKKNHIVFSIADEGSSSGVSHLDYFSPLLRVTYTQYRLGSCEKMVVAKDVYEVNGKLTVKLNQQLFWKQLSGMRGCGRNLNYLFTLPQA